MQILYVSYADFNWKRAGTSCMNIRIKRCHGKSPVFNNCYSNLVFTGLWGTSVNMDRSRASAIRSGNGLDGSQMPRSLLINCHDCALDGGACALDREAGDMNMLLG